MAISGQGQNGGGVRGSKTVIATLAITFLLIASTPFFFNDRNNDNNGNSSNSSNYEDYSEFSDILGAGDGGSSEFTTISAGMYHSLALRGDGTVWAWGLNDDGSLGDGTTTERTMPVQVHGPNNVGFLTDVIAVATGYYHSLALKSDGTVWAWGNNGNGRLGDGTTINRTTPVQVHGPNNVDFLTDVVAIEAGQGYSVALKSDGTVWAWGYNVLGQLGDGTTSQRNAPVQVHGANNVGFLIGVTAIAVGHNHTLALKSDGTVWAWGYNGYGQLGDGTTTDRSAPVQVHGPSNVGYLMGVTDIGAGYYHSLALKNDGTVWAWGHNVTGQLGDGTAFQRNAPVQVHGANNVGFLTGVTAIDGGRYNSLALKSDGTVWAWGSNQYGQLGNGTSGISTYESTPMQVHSPNNESFLDGVTAIAMGYYHALALKSDGTLYAWGLNDHGQLGDNSTTDRNAPVLIRLTQIGMIAVAAGDYHSLALKSDGTVWAWGRNNYGQLGDGTTTDRSTPVQVHGVNDNGFLTGVIAIAAGDYHSLALMSDGTVCAWGADFNGQLGDGSNFNRSTPVYVFYDHDYQGHLSNVIAVAAGGYHSLALKSDGTVWAWGAGNSGQLGNGDTGIFGSRAEPEKVLGLNGEYYLTGVTAIAAGGNHSLALKDNGMVWAWGSNAYGQFGNGTTTYSGTPVSTGQYGVTAIAAGGNHSLAIMTDGTVRAWGSNNYGQLGVGDTSPTKTIPVPVKDMTGVTAITAGNYHSFAVRSDGTLWAWGSNIGGTLGDGADDNSYMPVQVHGPNNVGYLTGVTAAAAGGGHSLALRSDGTVWAWGYGFNGQLGDGTKISRVTPVRSLVGDTTPPALIDGSIMVESITDVSLTLRWVKATDRETLEQSLNYYVYQKEEKFNWPGGSPDGTLLNPGGTPDISTYDVTGLSQDTKYYFVVVVEDMLGNAAAYSERNVTTMSPASMDAISLQDGLVGAPYSQNLRAFGTAPITWSGTGLPLWLDLDTVKGVISGTPTAAGTFTFSVTATNDYGSDTKTFTIEVVTAPTAPVITTAALDDGALDAEYSQTLTATGTAPITWSITVGVLPEGLTLDEETGEISGIPTATGIFEFTVEATNTAGSDTLTTSITIAEAPLITTDAYDYGVAGDVYSYTLTATGTAPITWSIIDGSLPTGLALSGSEISGTPTATGTFNIILKAENSAGSDTKAFSMIFTEAQNAPVITTTSLDDGRMDIGYSQSLTATGTSPITWSVIDGSLPPGLVLYPTGDIAGTPMEDGTFTFTVKAENIKDSDTLTTSIKIVAVPSAPGNFTLSPLNGEVVLTWTTPDRGPAIVKYQVSYGEADGYMTDWNDIAGSGPGTVTYTVTGLTNDTEYTFEVRAVSSEGDGDTSGILSATPSATATEPSAPRNLKAAAGDGDVVLTWRIPSNDGGSEITSYVVYCDASDGSTTNSFSDVGTALTYTVTGLINGTEYEFRVAAVNDAGEGVSSVTVTATPSGSAGTSEGGPNGGSGGDNGMILIAVGIVAAVVIVGAVYFFVIRKP